MKISNYSYDQLSDFINGCRDNTNFITNIVIVENDEAIATGRAIKTPESKFNIIISIYKEGKEKLRGDLFKYLVKEAQKTTTKSSK